MNQPNKYSRATDSLVRALVLDAQKPLPALAGGKSAQKNFDPNPFIEIFSRFLKKLEKSSWVWILFFFVLLPAMNAIFVFLDHLPSSLIYHLEAITLLVVCLFVATKLRSQIQRQSTLQQIARDKADSLLTMANMPWKIDRAELPGGVVEYRLVIPPEDHDIFAGSPTISIPHSAAEKADLLILAVKGDQKLLEKWSTRTLT